MSQTPQSMSIATIGWLSPRPSPDPRYLDAFRHGLAARGLPEHPPLTASEMEALGLPHHAPFTHFTIRNPSPATGLDILTERAQDLVRKQVNLIVASATPAAQAAKAATLQVKIPVLMVAVGEPTATGLVMNLAQPEGNITGFTTSIPQLSADRLDLLLALLRMSNRNVSRVAVLLNPRNPVKSHDMITMQKATSTVGMSFSVYYVDKISNFQGVFQAISADPPDALIVYTDPFTIAHRSDIIAFADQNKLPAVYGIREFVEDGGLIAYGPRFDELYREAATYAFEILQNGAQPGGLPVKSPTTFDLVIKNTTAQRHLNIQAPSSLLGKSVQVI